MTPPIHRARLGLWPALTVVAALSLYAACGDDEPTSPSASAGCVTDADCLPSQWCTESGLCLSPPGRMPPDAGTRPPPTSDVVVHNDTTATAPDIVQQDTPDLVPDTTPPEVTFTSPEAGEEGVAVPVTIKVTLSEPVAANTVASQTFKLIDPLGGDIPCTLKLDPTGTLVTMTPETETWHHASPYTVEVGPITGILADLAGNKLVGTHRFTFYTVGHPNTESYATIAANYAPLISTGTTEGYPQAQVPVAFDADGDWDGSNNKNWVASETEIVLPSVYYSVTETFTHYFIHYAYLFPWVAHPTAGYGHANGSSGAMVTVEKAAGGIPERPISVTTYSKEKGTEVNWTYGTTESAVIAGVATQEGTTETTGWDAMKDITAVYSQNDLFPGGRFHAYISAGDHESCLWIHEPASALDTHCKLNAGIKAGLTTLELEWKGGIPTPVNKTEGGWPYAMSDVEGVDTFGYALLPIETTLWPRRLEVGSEKVWGGTFNYGAAADRPAPASALPSSFVDPVDDIDTALGRPVWAWDHNAPGVESGVGKGWMGVDPAWYIWHRHYPFASDKLAWNAETLSGFAVDYCFNIYAGIDVRTTAPSCL